MQMHVGDKIATLRAESGLTQAQLSTLTGEGRAGVPQQTIEQLENNKNKTCRKMHLIAKALGVRLDDLIDDDIPVDQVIRINHHHALDTPNTTSETGTMQSNVVTITHKDGSPVTIRRVPVVSSTTAGDWGEVVDNFPPGYAERWIDVPDSISVKAFALVIIGKSMLPTIPDGATVIVDPTASYHHNSIVIVRQNGNKEATCKRLSYEGSTPYLIPDNEQFGKPELLDDAVIVGVVKQAIIDL